MKIEGTVFIITGAAQGIGKAIAEALLKSGAKVCLSDCNEKVGLETFYELSQKYAKDSVLFVPCDITDEKQFQDLWEKTESILGHVDVLINNAGMTGKPNLEEWKSVLNLNTMAVMMTTNFAFQKMSTNLGGRGGRIINIGSIAGLVPSVDQSFVPYFVSKNAVTCLTRSLGIRKLYLKTRVKVMCLCPFYTNTAMMQSLESNYVLKIKTKYGEFLSPENVSDALLEMIRLDSNGTVMAVCPNVPCIVIPSTQFFACGIYYFVARILTPFKLSVIEPRHIALTLFLFFVLLQIFITLFILK